VIADVTNMNRSRFTFRLVQRVSLAVIGFSILFFHCTNAALPKIVAERKKNCIAERLLSLESGVNVPKSSDENHLGMTQPRKK